MMTIFLAKSGINCYCASSQIEMNISLVVSSGLVTRNQNQNHLINNVKN